MTELPESGAARLAGPSSGRMLPSLELRFADGRPAPLWEFRGRGPLVVFLHQAPACAACAARLAELAAGHPHYRELGAQVLAVGREAVAGLPFPLLLDPGQRLAAALRQEGILPQAGLPALLVVGRTGEVWAAWAGAHAVLPAAAEIESWLEYALSECRECFCCERAWPEEWMRGEPTT